MNNKFLCSSLVAKTHHCVDLFRFIGKAFSAPDFRGSNLKTIATPLAHKDSRIRGNDARFKHIIDSRLEEHLDKNDQKQFTSVS